VHSYMWRVNTVTLRWHDASCLSTCVWHPNRKDCHARDSCIVQIIACTFNPLPLPPGGQLTPDDPECVPHAISSTCPLLFLHLNRDEKKNPTQLLSQRSMVDEHRLVCPLELIPCAICRASVPRSQMKQHMLDTADTHFALAASHIQVCCA
jgi:hypothetical protein